MNVIEDCFLHGVYYQGPASGAPDNCPKCKQEFEARKAKDGGG